MLEVTSTADGLSVRAPAKLNLILKVLGRREDGYHEIESLIIAVDLYDKLTAREDRRLSLRCEGEAVPDGMDNLVLRAASALKEATGCTSGAKIALDKSIPVGRGLGGGSSDAAATLVLLNELWGCGLSRAELAEIGARIGSDVPFFLGTPAAIIRGRGERVEPLSVGCRWHFLVVSPPFGLSTAEVYRALRFPLTSAGPDVNLLVKLLPDGTVEAVREYLYNSLSEPAIRLRPELSRLMERLKQVGARAVGLTGSGSAVFGIANYGEQVANWSQEVAKQGMGQVFDVKGLGS